MDNEQQFNEVDLETNFVDDDDMGFGGIVDEGGYEAAKNRDRNLNNSSLEDPYEINKVDLNENPFNSQNQKFRSWNEKGNFNTLNRNNSNNIAANSSKFDTIDMETDFGEDDDFGIPENKSNYKKLKSTKLIDFGDDEDDFNFNEKELIDEEALEEKKKKKPIITTGQVEDDYWKKLTQKHLKTNVKGAAGWHERVFAGDPQREMELFNHDMTSAASNKSNSEVVGSIDTNFDYGDGLINPSSSGDFGGGASFSDAGMGESLKSNNYTKLFENLLNLIGFEVTKNNDKTFNLIDKCNKKNKVVCSNKNDIINQLHPYLMDYIIYPLQDNTDQTYTDYKDWCNWYKDDICKNHPNCKQDIIYCDLISNHLNDINI